MGTYVRKLNTVISSRINRSLVLTQIHQNPMISRAQVAAMTGLDRSAITHILKELLERKLVDEVEKGKAGARGGRCPIYLRVNYGIHTLIAIDLGTKESVSVITDLAGRELKRHVMPIERGADFHKTILSIANKFKATVPDLFEKSVLVAISLPGVIDYEQRRIVSNMYHGWSDLDIGERLEEELGRPILLENDANAAALGQMTRLDQNEKISSMLYLFLRQAAPDAAFPIGAGGAMILDRRLWRGVHNCSGEIAQIVNSMMHRLMDHTSEAFAAMRGRLLTSLMADATEGKREARRVLSKIATEVGAYLADVAVFIDPDAVMVEVAPPENDDWFVAQIQKEFEEHYAPVCSVKAKFLRTPVDGSATIEGLIALGMERVFVPDASAASLLFSEYSRPVKVLK